MTIAQNPQRIAIAWIGLGEMGSRMAPRLVAAGYDVAAFDINPEAMRAAEAAGLRRAATPEDALAGAQVAFSMIPNDEVLARTVATACAACAPGTTLIDMSTVSPASSAEAASRLAEKDIAYLRAPVSGSTGLAAAGTLSILVSGPRAAFERQSSLLGVLGRSVRYLGDGEEARVAKLVVNAIVASLNQALGEALSLGRRAGLDWQAMIDLIADSVVASPYVASKVDRLKRREWLPAAAPVSLIAKDVRLALALAREVGAHMPLTAGAGAVLAAMEGRGASARDMCAVAAFIDPESGTDEAA